MPSGKYRFRIEKMGFWKKLTDAAPHKTHARADEIHYTGIIETAPFPPEAASVIDGKVCAVCKATFGEIFAKSRTAYAVTVAAPVSFSDGNSLIVCDKCVEHFGF